MKNKINKREKRENLSGFLFALPWIAGFLILSLYPLVMSFYYSFTKFSPVKDPVWIGLKNFIDLFHDNLFYLSLKNTLVFVVLLVPVTIIVSLFVAMILRITPIGSSFFRGVIYMPSLLPAVGSTLIWILLLDYQKGYINRALNMFGVSKVDWLGNPAMTKPALVLMSCWGIGTTVVIFLAAMSEVSADLYESASMDGANTIQQFFYITLPQIAHVLVYQIILGIINGFQYFTQVYVFCAAQEGYLNRGQNAGPMNSMLVYPLYLFRTAFTKLEMGKASAMAWILFLVVAAITFVQIKLSKKYMDVN